MTYLFRALPAVPYVYFSGTLGSGKTRAMKACTVVVETTDRFKLDGSNIIARKARNR